MFTQLFFLAIVGVVLAAPNNDHHRAFVRGIGGRIVGGDDADIKDFPWQVSLQLYGTHICGGSIISEKYIVTAAYCTSDSSESDLSIRVNTSIFGEDGIVVNVKKINQNPQFNAVYFYDYDISVLELEHPLTMGDGVQAIKLPAENETLKTGTEVTVTGWGTLSQDAVNYSPNLHQVKVTSVLFEECKYVYSPVEITDRMLCAGVLEGGKDACYGDTGGPLEADKTLWGIVSIGHGCARKGYPGIYANVATLRSYIKDITGL